METIVNDYTELLTAILIELTMIKELMIVLTVVTLALILLWAVYKIWLIFLSI